MRPIFDLDKIKFTTDRATFEKAVALYEGKKVIGFTADEYGCSAEVFGSRFVAVNARIIYPPSQGLRRDKKTTHGVFGWI